VPRLTRAFTWLARVAIGLCALSTTLIAFAAGGPDVGGAPVSTGTWLLGSALTAAVAALTAILASRRDTRKHVHEAERELRDFLHKKLKECEGARVGDATRVYDLQQKDIKNMQHIARLETKIHDLNNRFGAYELDRQLRQFQQQKGLPSARPPEDGIEVEG
jgi:hypothetical protein